MNVLLKLYGLAEEHRLMERGWFRPIYRTAYYAYKRAIEDPYYWLGKECPQLFAGGNILDVGANIGYTASVFASLLSTGFSVHAFEPEQRCFEELLIEAENSKGRIVPLRSAVGASSGNATLWRNLKHRADHRVVTDTFREHLGQGENEQSVPLISVDDYVESIGHQAVSFLKIDVQGYELEVLKGAIRTLEANPNLVVAFEHSPESLVELGFAPDDLISYFDHSSYKLYLLDRSKDILILTESELPELRRTNGYVDVLAVPSPMQSALR